MSEFMKNTSFARSRPVWAAALSLVLLLAAVPSAVHATEGAPAEGTPSAITSPTPPAVAEPAPKSDVPGGKTIRLDGYYSLLTPSGNAIALSKASVKNGTGIVLQKHADSAVRSRLFFASSKNGYHEIASSISFKALSVKGNSKQNGKILIQRTYAKKNKGQRFRIEPSGDGWYYLRSALGTYVGAVSDKAGAKIVSVTDRSRALKLCIRKTTYSSGSRKLDKAIGKLHKKIGTKGNTLKKSFRYVVSHYRHRNHPNDFSGDWIARYAYYMISKKHGHCKNFAATLCVLFRSYGYDARVVTGFVPSRSRGWAEHGWVEAKVGGTYYIFDADLHVQLGALGWYKTTYKKSPVEYRIEKRG
jgi:hypothetical protein